MTETPLDPNAVASVETDDGRVFAGVGVSEESLRETVEAHEPASSPEPSTPQPETATASTGQTPASDRNPDGTFKKPSRGQKRFDQLTAKSSDAEQRYEAERQRAAQLEQRLAALEASRVAPAAQTPPPSPAQPQTRPKPSENDVGVKYETYADFAEDLADWKVEQRFQSVNFDALVRNGIEADRASRAQQEHMQSLGQRARSVYSDFDAVLQSADVQLGRTPEEGEEKLKILLRQPNAEHLVYALGKNRQLQQEYARLADPMQIGMFLARIPQTAVASPASTAPPVASRAPAPYQPVGSGSKTSTATIEEAADAGNYDQYKALRAAQRKGQR